MCSPLHTWRLSCLHRFTIPSAKPTTTVPSFLESFDTISTAGYNFGVVSELRIRTRHGRGQRSGIVECNDSLSNYGSMVNG
jgi:hypothetical protein